LLAIADAFRAPEEEEKEKRKQLYNIDCVPCCFEVSWIVFLFVCFVLCACIFYELLADAAAFPGCFSAGLSLPV